MKLYLSSFRIGDQPAELFKLFPENRHVAIIPNAKDAYEKEMGDRRITQEIDDLTAIGLIPKVVNLQDYFGKHDALQKALDSFGGVWVVGGNTFTLRVAMAESGFDEWVLSKALDKDFVYAGYSAGICVLAPTLEGLDTVDDPEEVQEVYKKDTIWEGLGILDYSFAPHYRSDHPETASVEKEVTYMIQHKMPYKTLSDGDVIISHT